MNAQLELLTDLNSKNFENKNQKQVFNPQNLEIKQLQSDLNILKEIDFKYFKEMDPDEEFLNETNLEIENIENELLELSSIIEITGELVFIDQQQLDTVEKDITILEQNLDLSKSNNHIDSKNKIIGGIILGGILFGGIGAVFGIIPGVIAMGLGSGSAGAIGYFMN